MIFDVFINLELTPMLTEEMAKDIIILYSDNMKEEEFDYINFMESLLQEIKGTYSYKVDIIFSDKNSLLNINSNNNSLNPALSMKKEYITSGDNVNQTNQITNLNNKIEYNMDSSKIEVTDLKKEIKSLRLIWNKLKSKPKPNQEMTYNDFINFLLDSNILFPADILCQVLIYFELNPQSFTIKDLNERLEEAKISQSEISNFDIKAGIERISDILFLSEKTPKELYEMVSNTLFLSKDQFVNVIKHLQPNFNDILLVTIFSYYTKMTKFMRINDFKIYF